MGFSIKAILTTIPRALIAFTAVVWVTCVPEQSKAQCGPILELVRFEGDIPLS